MLAVTAVATSARYIRAERAQAEAERRFSEVRSLARYMLYEQYDGLENTPGTLKVRLALLVKAQSYLTSLAAGKDPVPDLALDIGQGFTRLAAVQSGRRGGPNLELSGLAGQNLAKADAVLTDALARFPEREDLRLALAELRAHRCSHSIYSDHGVPKAVAFAQSVEPLLGSVPDAKARDMLWAARDCRADAYTWLNKPKAAVPPSDSQQRELTLAYRFMAEAAFYDNDFPGSVAYGKRALATIRPLVAAHPDSLSYARAYVAALMITAQSSTNGPHKDYNLALGLLNDGSNLYSRFVARDPEDRGTQANLLSLEGDRASVLASVGRSAEARALASRAELLKAVAGAAAGCEGTRAALQAWNDFAHRFGLTDSDRHDIVVPLDEALTQCAAAR